MRKQTKPNQELSWKFDSRRSCRLKIKCFCNVLADFLSAAASRPDVTFALPKTSGLPIVITALDGHKQLT